MQALGEAIERGYREDHRDWQRKKSKERPLLLPPPPSWIGQLLVRLEVGKTRQLACRVSLVLPPQCEEPPAQGGREGKELQGTQQAQGLPSLELPVPTQPGTCANPRGTVCS